MTMITLYNILQLIFLPVALILTPIYLFFRKDQRKQIPARLGFGVKLPLRTGGEKIIWIQALSVGETVSVLPLLDALRNQYPSATIVLSSTTRNGQLIARKKASLMVDHLIPFPLDIAPVVSYFIKRVSPDLFILVETDFWPNFINQMSKKKIPMILVNGRISEKSRKKYSQANRFFSPLFEKFSALCMQTAADKSFIETFSIAAQRVHTLGNLKYAETRLPEDPAPPKKLRHSTTETIVLLCGSTHENEEPIILKTYQQIHANCKALKLIIAPRDIARIDQVEKRAADLNLQTIRFTSNQQWREEILLIDTIGDLANLYSEVDIAFIGGSLVPFGGHNPLEAVRYGIPVLFGPYTFNFQEICHDLVQHNASRRVTEQSFQETLHQLVCSTETRQQLGSNGLNSLAQHRNILEKYLEVISRYL